jgi:two-component system, cell cycle sensor histidine kinase and response regulator CckA
VGRDVTEREAARAALEAQAARLEEAQRIARLGSWTWDLATGESRATEELVRILGAPAARRDPIGTLFSLLAPEDRPEVERRTRAIEEQRLPSSEGTWHVVRPDGASRWVHTRSVWTWTAEGRRVAGAGTFQDVTEQVEAARALERERALLALSQELAHIGSWELDVATDAVTWSAEMYRIAGLSPDDGPMTRAQGVAMFPDEDFARMRLALNEGIAAGDAVEYEHRMVRPDGSVRTVLTRGRMVAGPDGATARVVGFSQDVTERRQLEEQVRQTQKMEALGLLAGSIAHDFNNLLSTIIGGAELARLDVADGSDAARDLDDVRQAAARAAQITRQLLAFSRKQARQVRALDLRNVVRAAAKLLRRLLPEGVALDVALAAEPAVVRADEAQLEQLLLNLVVNARDAIAAGGESGGDGAGVVTVTVARETGPGGERATLSVHDTGVGMDEATRARAFEPFFTTKAPGVGTGIGLATVLGIVEQSGGTVDVETAPGAGATFTVRLPLVDGAVDDTVLGAAPPPSGTETVLLVEDETVVRDTAARILERHGYRVLTARHGDDALLLWRAHAPEIELLVTDLRMPERGGQSLLGALRAERPSLPAVVMSGYASGRTPGERELLGREVFLAKPFTLESLLLQVRAALDGALDGALPGRDAG